MPEEDDRLNVWPMTDEIRKAMPEVINTTDGFVLLVVMDGRHVAEFHQNGLIRLERKKCFSFEDKVIEIPPPDDYVPQDNIMDCLPYQFDLLVNYIFDQIPTEEWED